MQKLIWILFFWVGAVTSYALGPHEIIVVVNGNSNESVKLARKYAVMRSVPRMNIIRLSTPDLKAESFSISPAEFTRMIWRPVNKIISERGLEDRVLAWVYSTGFPLRVETMPHMSIQGITFVRNSVPESREIQKGLYRSDLFAGPDSPWEKGNMSQTFDVYRRWLGDEMPLPSMLLGYSGKRGNTAGEITSCLKKGGASDGTAPGGTVYFVKSEDIRSRCRHWQYPAASRELRGEGIESVLLDRFPENRKDIIGLMMGSASVQPDSAGYFLPGAMGEHLTSAAAIFDSAGQTKLSAWIKAGATASAGTVTEPLSIWKKFPCARFFVHYARGCTVMESFFQSVRCPLQIVFAGDPLASPWSANGRLVLKGLPKTADSGKFEIKAEVRESDVHFVDYEYFLDDRKTGEGSSLMLDISTMKPGERRLRAVAYSAGLVRKQLFTEQAFTVVRKQNGVER